MEDTLLNVFVVVVSLLLSKDHVFHDQNDEITINMQDHERFLLEEGAKLEQGESTVAIDMPLSNQEASQSHHGVPRNEGDMSDVKQIMPNVLDKDQMSPVGEQNSTCQKEIAPDDQEILTIDELCVPNEGQTTEEVNVDKSGSVVDQNVSQGEAAQPEKTKNDQIDTHLEHQADQGLLNDPKTPTSSDQEDGISWYFWKTLSVISLLRVLKRFMRKGSKKQKKTQKCLSVYKVSNLDYKTLTSFHSLVTPSHRWQTCEFVEGFVNDLLETVRNMSTADLDVEIKDFVGVGSLYEQWSSRKDIVCDIHVPIVPPKTLSFEFELLKETRVSTTQYYCRIKVVKSAAGSNCPCCNSSSDDDDMLCLLHQDDKKDNHVPENYINDLLCQENSSYLAKTQVVKWFKTTVKRAWEEISHKYEFELIFWKRENPRSLKVRFRSGRVIVFNLTPVVKFKDTEVHLISYLPSDIFSDTHWPVCFAHYEKTLLQQMSKTLPQNACHIHCLQILSFLNKHQSGLTGPCGLTSYHLKNALFHLLLNNPLSWDPEQMSCKLDDLLSFLQEKIKCKMLEHALVGNPLVPDEIEFPVEFRVAKPVNLFLPLLSNDGLYLKTNRHLTEMIRNMPVMIYEYGSVKKM